ncbi:MAG: histidinol-phosphatase HisJ family protein [Chloroflexi bacterium]|nr:histidinol-phosphatase HisJ family protein [Chloroflexota bacterium]
MIKALPLVDYHVHTARCGHASGAMERYVEQAIEAGLTELGFSDHLFMYWLAGEKRDPELGMAEWEHDFYIQDVERCRSRYRSDITIRLATEADFIPGHERRLEEILRGYDWDYVIGSVHFVGEWGIDDSREIARYDGCDLDALYARYFSLVAESAETGLFDTIGHSDLVKKFGYRPTLDPSTWYAELAARLSRAGVCVEVNTAGLRKPVGEIYPHPDLLRALHAAGVPVTLGSDAHAPGEVAADMAAACALMQSVGYDEFVKYEDRRRTAVRLPAFND